jgi:hypothetical protein
MWIFICAKNKKAVRAKKRCVMFEETSIGGASCHSVILEQLVCAVAEQAAGTWWD